MDIIEKLIIGLIALMFVAIFLVTGAYYSNKEVVIATVKDKEAVLANNGTYLIFTDKGVLQLDDLFWKFKFNSSDQYNEIEEGKTYSFTVYGWRIPFFSMYQCIYTFVEVKYAE